MARILIVEDEPIVRELLQRAVEEWAHEVEVACDGIEGCRKIQQATDPFDVVFCDLRMPRMSGTEMLARVGPQLAGVTPIVIISGQLQMLDCVADINRYADCILPKPFELSVLRQTLNTALSKRKQNVRVQGLQTQMHALTARVDGLAEQNAKLLDEVRRDSLTGLYGRSRLEVDFEHRVARSRHGLGLAICDIDDFRRFNVECGYLGGDAAIQCVAGLLDESMRHGDNLYRWGGDEFVVLFECGSHAEADVLTRRLEDQVSERAQDASVAGLRGGLTMSTGFSVCDVSRRPALSDMFIEANERLLAAKSKRKGG